MNMDVLKNARNGIEELDEEVCHFEEFEPLYVTAPIQRE